MVHAVVVQNEVDWTCDVLVLSVRPDCLKKFLEPIVVRGIVQSGDNFVGEVGNGSVDGDGGVAKGVSGTEDGLVVFLPSLLHSVSCPKVDLNRKGKVNSGNKRRPDLSFRISSGDQTPILRKCIYDRTLNSFLTLVSSTSQMCFFCSTNDMNS